MPTAEFDQELQAYMSILNKEEKIRLILFLLDANDEVIEFWPEFPPQIGHQLMALTEIDMPGFMHLLLQDINHKPMDSHDASEIVQTVCKALPESSMKLKEQFRQVYSKQYTKHLRNLKNMHYAASPPSINKHLYHTKISQAEYDAIIKNGVDISEYIVLSVNLLLETINSIDLSKFEKLRHMLFHVQELYLNLDYEGCLAGISHICDLVSKNKQLSAFIGDIRAGADDLADVTPDRNEVRRAFETCMSQYIMGAATQKSSLTSIAKIATYFGYSVQSTYNIEMLISLMTNDDYNKSIYAKHIALQVKSHQYSQADSMLRPGFRERNDPGQHNGESSYSMNVGLFKANTPTFPEHQSRFIACNRYIDILEPDLSAPGYSSSNSRHRSVFVSSISGHTYFLVAMLEDYMQHNPGPQLERDVNHFLMAYIGTYAKLSYHSMFEVMDVLHEPEIAKIFAMHNVAMDLEIKPHIIQWAFNDALAYAKLLLLKRRLNVEIESVQVPPIFDAAALKVTCCEIDFAALHQALMAQEMDTHNPRAQLIIDFLQNKPSYDLNLDDLLNGLHIIGNAETDEPEETVYGWLHDKIDKLNYLLDGFNGHARFSHQQLSSLQLAESVLQNLRDTCIFCLPEQTRMTEQESLI